MLCVSLRCFGYFPRPLYLTVTCSEFASGVQDHGFFWEMAPLVSGTHLFDVVLEYRIFDFLGDDFRKCFLYLGFVGSTVNTSLRQSTVLFLHFSAMLGSIRSSFVLQLNAWFYSECKLRQSTELFRFSVQCLV